MSGVEWAAAGISLLGAGLAYVGARHGSRPEAQAVQQSERDEWGRRFTTAIELMADESERRRAMGRALLDALLASDLAQPDDLRLAQGLLRAAVLGAIPPRDLGMPTSGAARTPRAMDELEVVEDDGPRTPVQRTLDAPPRSEATDE